MQRLSWPEGKWLLDRLKAGEEISGLRHTARTGVGKREQYRETFYFKVGPRRWTRDDQSIDLPTDLVRDFVAWLGSELLDNVNGLHINRGDSWEYYFGMRLAKTAEQTTRT